MTANPEPGHPDRLPVEARATAGFEDPKPPIGWQAPLLDLVAAVFRRWQIFLIVMTLGVGVGMARYIVTRPFFRASCVAVLMPREKPIFDLRITEGSLQTGRDIAARGNTGALMLPAHVDTYTQLLRQDAVLISVGERFASRLGLPDDIRSVELVQAIRDLMQVTGTEDGMITVEATAPDPALAADIANALVDEMSDASKFSERQLLEQQVAFLRGALERGRLDKARSEHALQDFADEHGVVNLAKQTGDVLTLILEAEMRRLGVEQERIARLEAFTENDPVAQGLAQRIAALDAELERLRTRAHGGGTQSGLGFQELELELESLRADVTHSRDWVSTLGMQLALFTIRLDQPTGSVSVLKRAIPVRQRAGPSKGNTIGTSLLVALVLGIVLSLLREQWERVGRDPYLSRRAEEIRAHARLLAPAWVAARADRHRSRVGAGSGADR